MRRSSFAPLPLPLLFALSCAPVALCQTPPSPTSSLPTQPVLPSANYDEALVGAYSLPDPLRSQDGSPIQSATDWTSTRRPEILRLFEEHVYGRTPPPTQWGPVAFELLDRQPRALNGSATRKRIRIFLPKHPQWKGMEVLLYLPNTVPTPSPSGAKPKAFPCFVGLNFKGNHSVTRESDLPISAQWLQDATISAPNAPTTLNPEASRASEHSRWIPEHLIASGYALATAYYGDLEPDYASGWKTSLRAAISPEGAQTVWKPEDWGGIGAWAWGLSRILDYLHTDSSVNSNQCVAIGHSRLGKTALWATAQDPRFAMVVSNNSGELGAALMRRHFGETVAAITSRFPHWFAGRLRSYAQNEAACPVDQHLLIALAAPRPVAIGSAIEDRWADPKGEFLGGFHAGPVYALFGKKGLPSPEHPPLGQTGDDAISYHIRAGGHDLTPEDWNAYLAFADKHFRK